MSRAAISRINSTVTRAPRPVDSDLKRKTFTIIERIQRENPTFEIKIVKPLFSVEVEHPGSGETLKCKPDFVLEFVRNGTPTKVAIETMGMVDEEYENSKKRTHPIMMLKYGGLIQHRFLRGENYRLTTIFKTELMRFLNDGTQPAYETIAGRIE